VRRHQLEHVLRAASQIAGDPEVLVLGSQAILGGIPEHLLPPETTRSAEVDVAFFDDPDGHKWNAVDGAIGEMSPFDDMNGYYAQGVSVTTATLPAGWRDRLIVVDTPSTAPGRGHLLEPHDCIVSKLAAGREKDYVFAAALINAGLVDVTVLAERVEAMAVSAPLRQRMLDWLAWQASQS
jgi:hypothetical protein